MKKLLIAALVAVSPSVSSGAPPRQSFEPVSSEWLVTTFKSICFDAFGNSEKVRAAVETPELGFTKVASDAQVQIGEGWTSAKGSFQYTDSPILPRDLPSPQCSLKATADGSFDHVAAATAIQTALALPAGKTKGKKGRFSTEWNFPGNNGDKRRLFLSSEGGVSTSQVGLSLLNLRK